MLCYDVTVFLSVIKNLAWRLGELKLWLAKLSYFHSKYVVKYFPYNDCSSKIAIKHE